MRFRKDLGDLTQLKQSIKDIGLIHPIVKDSKGVLIAGARRLEACRQLGIEPIYRIVDFNNPIQAEIDENTKRKDFTDSEIFEINKYYNEVLSQQGNNQYSEKRIGVNHAEAKQPREVISDITGVGTQTLSKINKIFNSDNEELKKNVDEGKISRNEAYKIVVKEEKKQEKIKKLEEAAKSFCNGDIQSWYGDFYILSKDIPDNSIDAIITDPPYPEEYLYLWEQMFEVASRVLKPSGWLICYANHQNLDKIFRLRNYLLNYYWTFKLDFTSKPIAKGRNLIATWKPVLVYQKAPFKKIEETLEDNVKEYTKFNYEDRTLHDDNWGQAIGNFEYLIDKFTQPGDTILEPFAGTGTTLVAAQRMKRKCIGIELDELRYKSIIEGRLMNNV